ncbi:hypothetical protein HELRODRAFT_172907 [Helobdella robusta]|uniref:Peptidase M12B domain-containing protein n=1 Tax=Helobdella robusta TaxID=6412 RepID=T1F641_HELRO|nr:hypothetical protein HELRODRAFT_172907 [Helobdella robusta]ESO03882.1 hypothetical protein HELRODRAFT_172907 [Helobdella robusta]
MYQTTYLKLQKRIIKKRFSVYNITMKRISQSVLITSTNKYLFSSDFAIKTVGEYEKRIEIRKNLIRKNLTVTLDRIVRILKVHISVDYTVYKFSNKTTEVIAEDVLAYFNAATLAELNNMEALAKRPSFLTIFRIEKILPKSGHNFDCCGNRNLASPKTEMEAKLDSKKPFSDGMLGLADQKSMCTYGSALWVMDKGEFFNSVITVAHELGHIFGMEHVEDVFGCVCDPQPCVMDSKTVDQDVYSWASCSLETLEETKQLHQCLYNKNAPFDLTSTHCGNGLVDDGEDCDCGEYPEEICATKCCNEEICKFTSGSQCATGLCCDLNTCKLKSVEKICRAIEDDCDIEDRCDGSSNLCKDVHKQDGTMCLENNFCMNGKCPIRDEQCSQLWNDNKTVSASLQCYNQNKLLDNTCFNCDYDGPTGTVYPCVSQYVNFNLLSFVTHPNCGNYLEMFKAS